MVVSGLNYLLDAAHDTRGEKLQQWHDSMAAWQPGDLALFQSQQYTVSATGSPAPPVPPPGTAMVGTASSYGPGNFGESSFDVSDLF